MASEKITRNCPICSTEFKPLHNESKYCSHACRDEARRVKQEVSCPSCGTIFQVSPWQQRKRKVNFCSHDCYAKSLAKSWPERFWPKVHKTDSCWLWAGQINNRGYGYIQISAHSGKKKLAHRLSYELHHGKIPPAMVVRHTCDKPPCVNPSHLELGSQKQNMQDASIRGRMKGNRKITDEQVAEICQRRQAGETANDLAAEFEVHPTYVRQLYREFLTRLHLL